MDQKKQYFKRVSDWYKSQQGVTYQKTVNKRDDEDVTVTGSATLDDDNVDSDLVSKMEANATTIFISVKPSDLKRSTSEEMSQFEKEKLFNKADDLLTTQKSLLTDPTDTSHEDAMYQEAVSEAENEPPDIPPNNIGDGGSNGDDFGGETIAADEDSQKIIDKAQSMADAEIATEDTKSGSDLLGLADELLKEPIGSSVPGGQPCVHITATPSTKKAEDSICEIVTSNSTKVNVFVKLNTSTSKITTPDRPKREKKSTHMWEKFDWGPTGRRRKDVKEQATELFDTTCELCENELTPKNEITGQLETSTGLETEKVSSSLKESEITTVEADNSSTDTESSTSLTEIDSEETETPEEATTESEENTEITTELSNIYSTESETVTEILSKAMATDTTETEKFTEITSEATETLEEASTESEVNSEIATELSNTFSTESESVTKISIATTATASTETEKLTEITSQATETLEEAYTESEAKTEIPTELLNKYSTESESVTEIPTETTATTTVETEKFSEITSETTEIFEEASTESEVNTEVSSKLPNNYLTTSEIVTKISTGTTATATDETEMSTEITNEATETLEEASTESEAKTEITTELSNTYLTESESVTEIPTETTATTSVKTEKFTEITSETNEKVEEASTESEVNTEVTSKLPNNYLPTSERVTEISKSITTTATTETKKLTEIMSKVTETLEEASTESETNTEITTELSNKYSTELESVSEISTETTATTTTEKSTEIATKATATFYETFTDVERNTEVSGDSSYVFSIEFQSITEMSIEATENYSIVPESLTENLNKLSNNFPTEFNPFTEIKSEETETHKKPYTEFELNTEIPTEVQAETEILTGASEIALESLKTMSNSETLHSSTNNIPMGNKLSHTTQESEEDDYKENNDYDSKEPTDLEATTNEYSLTISETSPLSTNNISKGNKLSDPTQESEEDDYKENYDYESKEPTDFEATTNEYSFTISETSPPPTNNISKANKLSDTTQESEEDDYKENYDYESKELTDFEATTYKYEKNDDETDNAIGNEISENEDAVNRSLEDHGVVEHLNGLDIIPRTKKNIEKIRTGPHYITRVMNEHTIYNDDDEVVGVKIISRLEYKPDATEDAKTTEEPANTNAQIYGSLPCELCENENDIKFAINFETTTEFVTAGSQYKTSQISVQTSSTSQMSNQPRAQSTTVENGHTPSPTHHEGASTSVYEISRESNKTEILSKTGSRSPILNQSETESISEKNGHTLTPTQYEDISTSVDKILKTSQKAEILSETSSTSSVSNQPGIESTTVESGHTLTPTQYENASTSVDKILKTSQNAELFSETSSPSSMSNQPGIESTAVQSVLTLTPTQYEDASPSVDKILKSSQKAEILSETSSTSSVSNQPGIESTTVESGHTLTPTQYEDVSTSVDKIVKTSQNAEILSETSSTSSVSKQPGIESTSLESGHTLTPTQSKDASTSEDKIFKTSLYNQPGIESTTVESGHTLTPTYYEDAFPSVDKILKSSQKAEILSETSSTSPRSNQPGTESTTVESGNTLTLAQHDNASTSVSDIWTITSDLLLSSIPSSLVEINTRNLIEGISRKSSETGRSNITTTDDEYYDEQVSEESVKYTGTIHYTRIFEEQDIYDENDNIVALKNISRLLYADKRRRRKTTKEPINIIYEMDQDNLIQDMDENAETWSAKEYVQKDETRPIAPKLSLNLERTPQASSIASANISKLLTATITSSGFPETPKTSTITKAKEPSEGKNSGTAKPIENKPLSTEAIVSSPRNTVKLSESINSDVTASGITNAEKIASKAIRSTIIGSLTNTAESSSETIKSEKRVSEAITTAKSLKNSTLNSTGSLVYTTDSSGTSEVFNSEQTASNIISSTTSVISADRSSFNPTQNSLPCELCNEEETKNSDGTVSDAVSSEAISDETDTSNSTGFLTNIVESAGISTEVTNYEDTISEPISTTAISAESDTSNPTDSLTDTEESSDLSEGIKSEKTVSEAISAETGTSNTTDFLTNTVESASVSTEVTRTDTISERISSTAKSAESATSNPIESLKNTAESSGTSEAIKSDQTASNVVSSRVTSATPAASSSPNPTQSSSEIRHEDISRTTMPADTQNTLPCELCEDEKSNTLTTTQR